MQTILKYAKYLKFLLTIPVSLDLLPETLRIDRATVYNIGRDSSELTDYGLSVN